MLLYIQKCSHSKVLKKLKTQSIETIWTPVSLNVRAESNYRQECRIHTSSDKISKHIILQTYQQQRQCFLQIYIFFPSFSKTLVSFSTNINNLIVSFVSSKCSHFKVLNQLNTSMNLIRKCNFSSSYNIRIPMLPKLVF